MTPLIHSPLIGLGASAGTITGKVMKFSKGENPDKFSPGSILVTKMTDPSMIQVMIQAVAIVTDIGGITSHPAIVSRELGIPCVVNTKNATTVLRDGDIITVNGDTGKIDLLDR